MVHMQAQLIPFHELCDHRGRLIFLEEGGGCPFEIGEVRWQKPTDGSSEPVEWPSSGPQELLIALRGAVNARFVSAEGEIEVRLDAPHQGVLLNEGTRCSMRFLSPGATVLRLIASNP